MKKLLFTLILICTYSFSYSQNSVEKWNNLTNRYEYFDSNGNMTAYKVYSSLRHQWETYNVKQTNYNTPQSSFNTKLADETLNTLQARYDSNISKVSDKVKLIYKAIDYIVLDVMNDGAPSAMDYKYANHIKYLFQEQYVNVIQNKGYDYAKSSTTYDVIKYLENGSINLVKKELEWVEIKENYYLYIRKFSEKIQ